MSRAVITFLVLLSLLGFGTILLVEKFSHEKILPRSLGNISLYRVQQGVDQGQRTVKRWWRQLTAETASYTQDSTPVLPSSSPDAERKIIRWQDEKGVWHFEYEKTAAP